MDFIRIETILKGGNHISILHKIIYEYYGFLIPKTLKALKIIEDNFKTIEDIRDIFISSNSYNLLKNLIS